MENKDLTLIEIIVGYLCWILLAAGVIWIMISCGGCWDSGTGLFWH